MKIKSRMWVCQVEFFLSLFLLVLLGGCALTPKKPTSLTNPPALQKETVTPSRAYFQESPSLTGEDFAASAASLAKSAQALSQDAEKLRAKIQEPIQIASLPEKGASPLPTTAPTSKMLEMANSLSTQAQALSQDAEKLRAKIQEPIQIASLPEKGASPLPTTAPTSKMLEMANSLSTQAQALSQDAEKLRAKIQEPIQIASLPEKGASPLPTTAPTSKMLEMANSLSTQAQALSQDAEKLRAKIQEPIQIASLPEKEASPLPTTAPTSKMLEMANSLSTQAQALSQDAEKLRAKIQEPIQIASLPEKGASPLPTTAPTSKMLEMANSLSTQAQALSQDAEKLRAKIQEPIQIASLPEKGASPLPTTAPTSKMLEMANSLSTQAQALSQDAEKLRAKTAVPLPELAPLPSTNLGPKLVEVPVALVPEKEAEHLPSLKAVGKKKEEKSPLDDIFFDYDQYLLTEGAQNILQKNAEWLRSHPQARILIEGHCDERGTVEYNLALGERRAQSVKDYLLNLGISSDRISMISYGKEKPFVVSHSEEAWAQNRRAHFLLQSP